MVMLVLPEQAGFVQVSPKSELAVSDLARLGSGGAVQATMRLNHGKAFVRLRRFTVTASRFRLATRAGVAEVHGTEFATGVDESGLSSIGVASGQVGASAAGKAVRVNPGQMTRIIPGQPPSDPFDVPFVPVTLQAIAAGATGITISGEGAPGADITVNGTMTKVQGDGRFQAVVSDPSPLLIVEQIDDLG
jgi:hypothetical protein